MGTLFSTLDIATSGFRAAQVQLDVAGHNIANVNKQGYSRQRVDLQTRAPTVLPFGQLGRGVGIDTVRRIRDEFLDITYRQQVPRLGSADVLSQFYALIEDAFLEPGPDGFGTRINNFFDTLSDFANQVEELPVREVVLSEAEALAGTLNELAKRFNALWTNANEEIRNQAPEINSIAERISTLNQRIRVTEFGGHQANDLRDDRDLLVDQLARLVNISYAETESGEYTILIGSDVLVDSLGYREVAAVTNATVNPERPDLVELQFVDNNQLLDIQGGEVFGAITARDTIIPEVDQRMDTLTATIIEQLNRIQNAGNGQVSLTGTVTGTNQVNSPANVLTGAGLPFTVTPGSFQVAIYDATNTPVGGSPFTINITAASTLNSLVADLNALPNLTATVSGNALEVTGAAGFSYAFGFDTSNVLSALGVVGLFTGTDARTIAVDSNIQTDPGALSAGYSTNPLDTGDNTAALDMAAVRFLQALDSGTTTINQHYESTIATLGVDARTNLDTLAIEEAFVADFDRRRQDAAGVSLDEEVTSLILFQRAFEASARVINVTERMLDALMSITQ